MQTVDDLEREEYFERNLFVQARENSLVTGDRFVPGCRFDHDGQKANWCVIDTHREERTEHGLTFDVALDHAERFSRLDKTQKEDIFRSRCTKNAQRLAKSINIEFNSDKIHHVTYSSLSREEK